MYLCDFFFLFLAIISLSQSQGDNLELLLLLPTPPKYRDTGRHALPYLLVCKQCWRVTLTSCMQAPEIETAKYSRKPDDLRLATHGWARDTLPPPPVHQSLREVEVLRVGGLSLPLTSSSSQESWCRRIVCILSINVF